MWHFWGDLSHYLSELRKRFIETLGLTEDHVIFPQDSQYYVAVGAALMSEKYPTADLDTLIRRLSEPGEADSGDTKYLPALFESDEEYKKFIRRHSSHRVPRKDFSQVSGPVFLGIDAGSTTTKAALTDREGNLIYTFYRNNEGSPVETSKILLKDIYSKMHDDMFIAYTVTTGYGEQLIKAAFGADYGEIETIAHYKAAENTSCRMWILFSISAART